MIFRFAHNLRRAGVKDRNNLKAWMRNKWSQISNSRTVKDKHMYRYAKILKSYPQFLYIIFYISLPSVMILFFGYNTNSPLA